MQGLIVRNNSNFVQIDQNFRNYSLLQEGTLATETNLTFAPNGPYLFFIGPTPANRQVYLQVANANTVSLRGTVSGLFSRTIANFSVAYRIYALGGSAIVGSHGLQVRGSNGSLIFDSRLRYPQVNQCVRFVSSGGSALSISRPSGSTFLEMTSLSNGDEIVYLEPEGSSRFFFPTREFKVAYDIKPHLITLGSGISYDPNPTNNFVTGGHSWVDEGFAVSLGS